MIPRLTTNQIIALPLSKKEKLNPSRNRKGYHVFLSWYFCEFKLLNEDDKLQITSPYRTVEQSDDESTILIHVSMVMKAAASHWKQSPTEFHAAWSERTNQLNTQCLPGSFRMLPSELFVDGLEYNTRLSVQSDWAFVVRKLMAMITKRPQNVCTTCSIILGRKKLLCRVSPSLRFNLIISLVCAFLERTFASSKIRKLSINQRE